MQENLQEAALDIEKQKRTLVEDLRLQSESRGSNKVILSKNALNVLVLLNKIPAIKTQEYNLYPFSHQLGFIHLIPEEEFDIATATIVDVGFLGLFPKVLLQVLCKYGREIKRLNQDNSEFMALVEELITAFIYRPITLQKIIQLMVTKMKDYLETSEPLKHHTLPDCNRLELPKTSSETIDQASRKRHEIFTE